MIPAFLLPPRPSMRPGIRFHPGAVRPAGHIFFMPAAERVTDDTKNRPHFLANRCDPAADPDGLATLAHMSIRNTECVQYGCSCHRIFDSRPRRADQDGNYVVAARLVPELPENLKVSGMSAVDEVPSVRAAVMRAIAWGDERTRPVPEGVRGGGRRPVSSDAQNEYPKRAQIQLQHPHEPLGYLGEREEDELIGERR